MAERRVRHFRDLFRGGHIPPTHTHPLPVGVHATRRDFIRDAYARSFARSCRQVRSIMRRRRRRRRFHVESYKVPVDPGGGGAFLGSGILPGDDATLATPRVASFRRKVTLRLNRTFDRGGRRRLSGSRQSQVDREILRRLRRR